MKRIAILRKIALELFVTAANNLSDMFFSKLKSIAEKHGMNPADLLLVMYSESGVNPSVVNSDGGAAGIGQFMPFVLKNLGWKGTPEEFSKLPAEQQLDYMDKVIQSNVATNGGKPFQSATQYYQAHFLPATLSRGSSLDTIIADGRPGMAQKSWEKPAYDHNKGFDQDNKGYITVGDLDKWVNKKRQESGYKQLLARLNSVNSGDFKPSNNNAELDGIEDDIGSSEPAQNPQADYLNNLMDSIQEELSSAASYDTINKLCSKYSNLCLKRFK